MIREYTINKPNRPKRKTYTLSLFKGVNCLQAEEHLPFRYSPKSYNFSFDKGVLDPGYGVSAAYLRQNGSTWQVKKRGIDVKFLKLYHYTMHNANYRLEKLLAYGDDGKIYDTSLNVLNTSFVPLGSYGEVMDAVPYSYNDRDGLLVSTSSGLYFVRDSSVTNLSFGDSFKTMCVHNERVFAVLFLDEYRLNFSDDFDPTNWNVSLKEGGYVNFGAEMGKIVKLVSFAGQLFLFFEHGIMRMTAYNDQTEFRVQRLYLSPGTVYKDTIAVCGDKIMFAASDGVFLFDGLTIKKVLTEIENLFSNDQPYAHAVHHGGKYYLVCNLEMDSLIENAANSLVVYDTWKQTFDIAHDLTLPAMVALNLDTISGVLTEVNYPEDYLGLIDRSGKINSSVTYKIWNSPVTALGTNSEKKLLREVRVRCEGGGLLEVWLNGQRYYYDLAPGLNKARVMRPFDTMQIALITAEEGGRITDAELTVDHFGE